MCRGEEDDAAIGSWIDRVVLEWEIDLRHVFMARVERDLPVEQPLSSTRKHRIVLRPRINQG